MTRWAFDYGKDIRSRHGYCCDKRFAIHSGRHERKCGKMAWPYVKLDPEKTAEIAYDEWYRVFCGAAMISSVFGQLREKVGEPYKSFPIDAFVFLEGGTVG